MTQTYDQLPDSWFEDHGAPSEEGDDPAELSVGPMEIARRLATSERLSRRHYAMLPLVGPGAVFTEVQGRLPGDATSADGLVELMGSIGVVGVLQPILVEELGEGHRLVSGERRLRACRLGLKDDPENPHFAMIPALICPGPLSEEERRAWQLIENLAREDLQPGELGLALVFERCAMLATRLIGRGVLVPRRVFEIDDPLDRWEALVVLVRSTQGRVDAPWAEVLRRLGLHQLSPSTAKQMTRALKTLPPELTSEFDKKKIALATRLEYVTLRNGSASAAIDLWEAVKQRGSVKHFRGAIRELLDHPALDPVEAVERAEERVEHANRERGEKLRRRAELERFGMAAAPAGRVERSEESTESPRLPAAPTVDAATVKAALQAFRNILRELRVGAVVPTYDAGSLRLCTEELLSLLDVSDATSAGEGGER